MSIEHPPRWPCGHTNPVVVMSTALCEVRLWICLQWNSVLFDQEISVAGADAVELVVVVS